MKYHETLRGLWIADYEHSHLGAWLPRLQTQQFVPLVSGLNVVYGRNGAGKSQILEAIALAAEYRHSAYEGFVYENITRCAKSWNDGQWQEEHEAVFASNESVMAYWLKNVRCNETGLGWQRGGDVQGFDARSVDQNRLELVFEVLNEFRRAGTVLKTREALVQDDDGPMYYFNPVHHPQARPDRMRRPRRVQYVPILLPDAEAPVTRALLAEMIEEIGAAHRNLDSKLEEITYFWEELDEQGKDPGDAQWDLYGEHTHGLARGLRWNPLFNRRNHISFAGYWSDDNIIEKMMRLQAYGAICLPAVDHFEIADKDETDFPSEDAVVALPIAREESSRNVARGGRYIPVQESENSRLHAPTAEEAQLLLRAMLNFLPNADGLSVDPMDGEVHWTVSKTGRQWSRNRVSAGSGSNAETRWLDLAMKFITNSEGPRWLVIDEPEQGLHRAAEALLGSTLRSPAWSRIGPVVAATHSPELLNDADLVLHIDDGLTQYFDASYKVNVASLGLRPGDILIGTRIFLLVEGEHDRIVLEGLLAAELRRLRCVVIAARGGKNMSQIFDSQFLFDMTDARMVCLLDNLDAEMITALWAEATRLTMQDADVAENYVLKNLPRRLSGENRFMSQFMTKAIRSGAVHRVAAYGLGKQDILMYLNPKKFNLSESWENLYSIYLEIPQTSDPLSFKEWLKRTRGADFSLSAVRAAVESLDTLPADIGRLMLLLADLGQPHGNPTSMS